MNNLIAGNWKMNPASKQEAEELFNKIKNGIEGTTAEVVICAPFVYLPLLKGLKLGAQNVYFEDKGTFTGEISAKMLKDLGVEYVIVGHSERRKYFGETDEAVNKKIKKSLEVGLKVIFCVGENLEEREQDKTKEVLERQIKIGLSGVDDLENINIAYEPVWAISSGDPYKTKELPTPEKVKEIADYIREFVRSDTRIIYGGSANGSNSFDYLKNAGVQGLLPGGASLNPEEFIKIVKSAE